MKTTKKNYISYLKEYNERTSLFNKSDKYRKKFITTCYADKENIDPNIAQNRLSFPSDSHQNHLKSKPMRRSKSKEKNHYKLNVAAPNEINISPYKCEMDGKEANELYLIEKNNKKMICCKQCSSGMDRTIFYQKLQEKQFEQNVGMEKLIKLKMKFSQIYESWLERGEKQKAKSNTYYQNLKKQLELQEKQSLEIIQACITKGKNQFVRIIDQITQEINKMISNKQLAQRNYEIPTHLKFIDLQMVSVNICAQSMKRSKQYIEKCNLLIYNQISHPKKAYEQKGGYEEDNLNCSEELDNRTTIKQNLSPLDISFEDDGWSNNNLKQLLQKEDDQAEQLTISPCFKVF